MSLSDTRLLLPRTLVLCGLLVAACAGNGNEVGPKSGEPRNTRPEDPPEGVTRQPEEISPLPQKRMMSDEDEIIPLVEVPDVNIAGEDIPDDPAALRDKAKAELEAGNVDDALSMIDVLLVLNPEDAELIETRSEILMKQGLKEDAAVDRARCCRLGRTTCCP